MNSPPPPCVLVYSPCAGHGHHDSWSAMFVSLLLERGYRVLALIPERASFEVGLDARGGKHHPRLAILEWNCLSMNQRFLGYMRRVWDCWHVYGDLYANGKPESAIKPQASLLMRLRKRLLQVFIPLLFRATQCLFPESPPDPSVFHCHDPIDMALRIRAALRQSPWQPGCVLNLFLDVFRSGRAVWERYETVSKLPWCGIKFVSGPEGQCEGYFNLSSLRALALLDESLRKRYERCIPDRHLVYLPDVTNGALPVKPPTPVMDIRQRKKGRITVMLGGSISNEKNIARWCELILLADPNRWFFAQIGEVAFGSFTTEQASRYEQLLRSNAENYLLYPRYLPDEREFNAMVCEADILFAAYRDFTRSSNILAKAAMFKKPVLVSGGYLMAERVRRYGIGSVVDQDDVPGMLAALEGLMTRSPNPENYAAYCEDFGERAAGDVLEELINATLPNRVSARVSRVLGEESIAHGRPASVR